ncbi:hypothetical protein HPB51_003576 [Rhipicephalus microplus]|uniref:HBS1-like protein n=1 Tax=Rhipicephalus microplus TaxID=6941 RepID=A0A9J6E6P2_RHIMP|nr:hypothetical protein HPB51_003576 [Rhipicephalus microplus]
MFCGCRQYAALRTRKKMLFFLADYEGYYDVYGRSQEEDSCISPTTEEQFLYNRDKLHSMSSFLSPEVLQEENEEEDEEDESHKPATREPQLSPVDEVRLYECIEKMQNVVGDSIPEATLRRVALEGDFNAEVALDRLLRDCSAESRKADSLPKAMHSISGCDGAPQPLLVHDQCETVPETSLAHASSTTCDLSTNLQVSRMDSRDGFLEALLQEGNVPSDISPSGPTGKPSSAVPDELDLLLGMVSSHKPHPVGPIDTSRHNNQATSASASRNVQSVGKPVKDDVGDSLDELLGIGADSSAPRQGGKGAIETDFDDFLMSLRTDFGGASDLTRREDGLGMLPIADVLSAASSDEKGPMKSPQKPSSKKQQPALLNLGEILGLNREPTPNTAAEGGALKLDDILKGTTAVGVAAVTRQESHSYGYGSESPEFSPLHSTAAVKEASLFGKVLVYFCFVRRQMPTFELMSWLRKLGVLELRPGDKTRMAAFNFGVPSPDDIVRACRKRAVAASERKPTPLGQVGAPARAAEHRRRLSRYQVRQIPTAVLQIWIARSPLQKLVGTRSQLTAPPPKHQGPSHPRTWLQNMPRRGAPRSLFSTWWSLGMLTPARAHSWDTSCTGWAVCRRSKCTSTSRSPRNWGRLHSCMPGCWMRRLKRGAAQADVAILVVDATRGEFETGFETGGQTREHTLLVRSLGVSQLAVAINKLDNVSWDEGRYNEITAKLRSFLRQAGYRESDFTFVPCSGLTGENLTTKPESGSPLTKWYMGPCLVDVIDSFKPPERPVSKPFRLCVSDVFKGQGSGFCVSGRIDAGCVANGDKVLVMPAAEQGTVKGKRCLSLMERFKKT